MNEPARRWTLARIFWTLFAIASLTALGSWFLWKRGLESRIQRQLAAIREDGLPTSALEINAWMPGSTDRDDGAWRMRTAVGYFVPIRDGSQEAKISRLKERDRWTDALRELETNQVAFAKLDQALAFQRFRYVADYSPGVNTLLPHLSGLRTAGTALFVKAALAAENGDSKTAAACVAKILRLADSLDEEPLLVSWMFRMSLVKDASLAAEWILNRGSMHDEDCQALQKAFANSVATNSLPLAMAGERALGLGVFGLDPKTVDQFESLVIDQGSSSQQGKMLGGTLWRLARGAGLQTLDANLYLDMMGRNLMISHLAPPASLALTNTPPEIADKIKSGLYPITRILFNDFGKAAIRDAETRAHVALARTALAIERFRLQHNSLPATLEELVPHFLDGMPLDPFDAQPLRYRREAAGYSLWSIGPDLTDNNGQDVAKREPPDLVFKVSR
jgi:hypothetical protein